MHKWFVLMHVSSCKQHIHQNNPDTKEFLTLAIHDFSGLNLYSSNTLKNLKETSSQDRHSHKETYHALVFTTVSNMQCMRLLLSELRFQFVLTRKLSSDPTESFFGILLRCAGCNDMLDVRSTRCGIEKVLKTGIVASSKSSNVSSSTYFCSSHPIVGSNVHITEITPSPTVKLAQQALRDVCMSATPVLPTALMTALSFVGGYIARAVAENIACDKWHVDSCCDDCTQKLCHIASVKIWGIVVSAQEETMTGWFHYRTGHSLASCSFWVPDKPPTGTILSAGLLTLTVLIVVENGKPGPENRWIWFSAIHEQ
ncbi:hypothetical protein HPB48_026428 [Haemaphysalis longicornis]|uniref:Uncharacterized protein n=1 Tax=Haemaphysalis longicornis TaxID=44386 RepID=A0A9J6HCB0_HAELO|nr:hypothetical protein HPB48_026428 [Haemaphysalis longicornis]